jgi:regulator of protease activity HflC (stomatin/prohibitin superfamily)
MKPTYILIVIVLILGFLILTSGLYTVKMTEQVIITRFGKPVGAPIKEGQKIYLGKYLCSLENRGSFKIFPISTK